MIYSISIKDFLKSIEQQLKTPSKSKNGEGYTSDTLNKNGDETFKSGVKNNVINTNFDPFHLQNNFFKTKALNLILDFSKWCKTNNIRLFMTYPNTISNKNYFDDKYVKYFNMLEKFYNDNEINVISEPHLSMYSKEFFYDTQYHMNIKGSKIRTIKMISDLKKHCNLTFRNGTNLWKTNFCII